MRWVKALRWGGLGAACALAATALVYRWDMHRAYRRIEQRGTVVASPYGDIEYTQSGKGPAVLVIHGSGGGYDQGELIVEAVLGDDFHCVTPSRFGYLRSTFHAGATFDAQAHAYAHLMNELGLERVAVVSLSQGGPSALLFATLYPERVSSLTLISAGVAASSASVQQDANDKGNALTTIFAHDWLYWAVSKVFRGQFLQLMGASDAVVAGLTEAQSHLIDRLIEWMNPVSPRSAGAAFDNQAQMPNERIAAVRAPTLILHAKDDGLQLFHNAEFAAAHIPGARLVAFEAGGHLLMITERERLRELIQAHIHKQANTPLAR
jgi:2-hydroxy-6-oxonona-2,4-dienedioate hydrolase